MTTATSNEASWSQFWASGSLTAFYGKKDNYGAEFLEFWRTVLNEPAQDVIDLGCGNGALTWIADEILNQPEPVARICGIDLAIIDPFVVLKKSKTEHPNVSFIGGCSMEAMPFETASVDLAISQYGIEYSVTERVLPELGRVLKPKARLGFVLHDADSSILRFMEHTARAVEFLFQSGGYYAALFRLDKIHNKNKTVRKLQADPQYRATVRTLWQIKQRIERMQPSPVKDFLMQHVSVTNRLFAKGQPIRSRERREALRRRRQLLEGTQRRYKELRAAALSNEQYGTLHRQVEREGFGVVQKGNIFHNAEGETRANLGWVLVADR